MIYNDIIYFNITPQIQEGDVCLLRKLFNARKVFISHQKNQGPSINAKKKIIIKEEKAREVYDACKKHGKSSRGRTQVDASPTHVLCGSRIYGS